MTHIKGYEAAQRAWESQLPPEGPEESDLECLHIWRLLGRANGSEYYVCKRCGEQGEM